MWQVEGWKGQLFGLFFTLAHASSDAANIILTLKMYSFDPPLPWQHQLRPSLSQRLKPITLSLHCLQLHSSAEHRGALSMRRKYEIVK